MYYWQFSGLQVMLCYLIGNYHTMISLLAMPIGLYKLIYWLYSVYTMQHRARALYFWR
jgi:hypothetical protein